MAKYKVIITETAMHDLRSIPAKMADRVLVKSKNLENGLSGDIKRLKDFKPAYRLRVGDYRVLFDLVADGVIEIVRVKHRKDAYE